ncbi:MAG: chaperone NapD [Coriobacteriia bacterium]|nr:chaperone NapD [Coriobacteriia bacterium]
MAISSLVIDAMPDSLDEVSAALDAIDGVEVQGSDVTTGRIVVTIEAPSIFESKDIADSFIGIPNVINVNLVYVNVEDELEKEHAASE